MRVRVHMQCVYVYVWVYIERSDFGVFTLDITAE